MRATFRRDPATLLALGTFVKLRRAVNTVTARLNPVLQKEHGLTESQFGVLEALWHLGPMMDNLERDGLVRRDPNPEDRRAHLVRLSEKGKALVADAFPAHAARIAALLGVLTATEQRELGRLCRKLGLAIRAES
jgi:MarR family 2-MHQ and catechol resistance regulon transcriptional repressor